MITLDPQCCAPDLARRIIHKYELLTGARRSAFGWSSYPRRDQDIIDQAPAGYREAIRRACVDVEAAADASYAALYGGLIRLGYLNMPGCPKRY